ncbi:MAG: hypothetical protein KC620_05360 [Myxococcales bacterium]|nr:hypothetical protein [Myxococcales bacterium]
MKRHILALLTLGLAIGGGLALRGLNGNLAGKAIGESGHGALDAFRVHAANAWADAALSGDALADGALLTQVRSDFDSDLGSVRMAGSMVRFQPAASGGHDYKETVDILAFRGDPNLLGGGLVGETGSVTANASAFGATHHITFTKNYAAPVVFAQLATYAGAQPMEVHAANVTTSGADLIYFEPNTFDGAHMSETVHYVVLESGVYTLNDGRALYVGKQAQNGGARGYDASAEILLPNKSFGEPIVITTLQSVSRPGFANTRVKLIDDGSDLYKGFAFRFAHEDDYSLQDGIAMTRSVGFLALYRPWTVQPGRVELRSGNNKYIGFDLAGRPRGTCINLGETDLNGTADRMIIAAAQGTMQVSVYPNENCDMVYGGEFQTSAQTATLLWLGTTLPVASIRVTWNTVASVTERTSWHDGDVIVQNESAFLTIDNGELRLFRVNEADRTLWQVWSTSTSGRVAEVRFLNNGKVAAYDEYGAMIWSTATANKGVTQIMIDDTCLVRIATDTGDPAATLGEGTCNEGAPTAAVPSMPGLQVAYVDLDRDGNNELVIIVKSPDGTGAIMYDPLGIADLLTTYGFHVPADFWNLLSPTQQAVLLTQVPADRGYGETIEGEEAEELTLEWDALVLTRPYNVIHFEFAFDGTGISVSDRIGPAQGSIQVGNVHFVIDDDEYGAGFEIGANVLTMQVTVGGVVTVSGSVGTVNGALNMDRNGFVMGAEASVVGVAFTLGNENGSYVGLNADIGVGFWAAVSAGKNGQYGFSLSVPVVPVGVAIYVSGDDVIMAYEFTRDWAIVGAETVEELAPQLWAKSSEWIVNHDAGVVTRFENAAADTRIYMKRAETEVKVIISDTSHTFETVIDDLDDLEDGLAAIGGQITDTVDTIGNTLEDWANGVGQFATNAYGSLINGAKTIYKKVKFW